MLFPPILPKSWKQMPKSLRSFPHYDLGEIYDPGNFANTLIYMTQTNDRDYASKWAKNERLITRSLDKMLENFGVEG